MKKIELTIIASILMTILSIDKAHSQPDIGADIVSAYIWRGTILADGPSVQPRFSYSTGGESVSLELGAWGSYTFFSFGNGSPDPVRPSTEADLYGTLNIGALSLTITDYYFPSADGGKMQGGGYFDYQSMHTLEASIGAEIGRFSALAAWNFAGNRDLNGDGIADPGVYFEVAQMFQNGLNIFLGAGDEFYGCFNDEGKPSFGLVNVGIGYEKEALNLPVFGQIVLNPSAETLGIVFGVSF